MPAPSGHEMTARLSNWNHRCRTLMNGPTASPFSLKIYHHVDEAGEAAWNELAAGRPFQSSAWYRYGERVMDDCEPVYMVVHREGQPIARATFWVIRNEPLPVSGRINDELNPILKRWPLFICRSPLSNSSGLILPEATPRDAILQFIAREAEKQAKLYHCSFLIFDFLTQGEKDSPGWPGGYIRLTGGGPGTRMKVQWSSFENYIESRDSRNRRRIAHDKRKAAELGIGITKYTSVGSLEDALRLIQRVEDKYQSPHNPWMRKLLENMNMVESTFLEARAGTELVGCELLLYDNQVQLPTALGHAGSAEYDYLEILYTNICEAIEKGCQFMRWGSGSYDIKRHLGFELEYSNNLVVCGVNRFSKMLTRAGTLFVQ